MNVSVIDPLFSPLGVGSLERHEDDAEDCERSRCSPFTED